MEVFTNISIFPKIKGGTVISWEINPYFTESSPYVFTVEVSHSATSVVDSDPSSDWTTVATVTNTYTATDTSQRTWANSDRVFYRIKLVTGASHTYYSYPSPTWGKLNFHDIVIAKEIIRKENLLLTKYTGNCGLLFKRRTWGELCPNTCLDFDTKEVIKQDCSICFGTGYRGGYFVGLPFWINTSPVQQNRIARAENAGMQDLQNTMGRSLACPIPKTNDFWIDTATDERWIIQNTGNIAKIKNMPLVLQLEMRLVAPTDVIQSIDPAYNGMT